MPCPCPFAWNYGQSVGVDDTFCVVGPGTQMWRCLYLIPGFLLPRLFGPGHVVRCESIAASWTIQLFNSSLKIHLNYHDLLSLNRWHGIFSSVSWKKSHWRELKIIPWWGSHHRDTVPCTFTILHGRLSCHLDTSWIPCLSRIPGVRCSLGGASDICP